VDHELPVPLHHARPRRHRRGRARGAHGQRARRDGRQGRVDALLQQGAELLRRPGHRRRPGPRGHGPRLRQQVQDAPRREDARRDRLLRRRRGEPGPDLGVHEHGCFVEIAHDLLHREQPVRHGHVHLEVVVQQRLLHDGQRHSWVKNGALPCENKNSRHRRDGLFPHRTA